MDDKPKDRPSRAAKRAAINLINTTKRSASTHKRSGRTKKARKTAPSAPSPGVDKGVEDVSIQFHKAPATECQTSYTSSIISASDMQKHIAAEAHRASRKNIPWDKFRSMYLCDFSVKARRKLVVKSVKKIGEGNWEEQLFRDRLRQSLSDEVLGDLKLFYGGTQTLPDANEDKEVFSKPDFVLHVGEEPPIWADVSFYSNMRGAVEETVTRKFSQWLRNAWNVFHHQPFRRHLYGIMFAQPCAYVCYVDHGCAVYSEPLYFAKNTHHTQFLADFLTRFIANPGRRGRDPTVGKGDRIHIRHAETTWIEALNGQLCYRPCLIGRDIRVALVREHGAKFPKNKMVMKSTWEEKLSPASSPPSEVEVLKILKANVRGLPQPYALEGAIVRDDDNLEVETRSFPDNCEVALPASTTNPMMKMRPGYTSKPLAPGANVGGPLEVRRRLTRILMSYCVPLKEAMRTRGPESLMRIIRDAMIVYYEAYKLPGSGFIHGDISINNILVPVEGCVLTGGLTHEDRCGTIIDWNLCFNADGISSDRPFKSGTPVFMASALLNNEQIPRRTLGHDMESFFSVIIWVASLNYADEAAFLAKPLVSAMQTPIAKEALIKVPAYFGKLVLSHFELAYRKDWNFLNPNSDLGLDEYMNGNLDKNDKETEDADPMKEGLFRMCMKEIDDYLHETKGCCEMKWIDSQAPTRHTPESLMQEGNRVD